MKKNELNETGLRPGLKTAIKWAAFVVIMIFAYSSSTAGSGGKPAALVLFPLAAAVAVYESEIPAAVFGSCAGLLLDVSLGKLPGFTALWLCLCCAGTSALFSMLLRKNIVNYLWTFAVTGAMYLGIDYYFYYKIWEYEGHELILKRIMIPSALKTLAWAIPIYILIYILERLSGEFKKLTLEEQDKNIDRV